VFINVEVEHSFYIYVIRNNNSISAVRRNIDISEETRYNIFKCSSVLG